MDDDLHGPSGRVYLRPTRRSQRFLRGCLWVSVILVWLAVLAIPAFYFLYWLPAFKAAQ
jgi:hypothetical protein